MNRIVFMALAGLTVSPLVAPMAAADPELTVAEAVKALPSDRDFPSGWKTDRGQAGWTAYTNMTGSDSSGYSDSSEGEIEPEGCDPDQVMTALKDAPMLAFVKGNSRGGGPEAGEGDEVEVRITAPQDADGLFGEFADFAARCPQFSVRQDARPATGERSGAFDGSFLEAPVSAEAVDGALALTLRARLVKADGSALSAVAEEQVALFQQFVVISYGARLGSSDDDNAAVALSRRLFVETVRRLHNGP